MSSLTSSSRSPLPEVLARELDKGEDLLWTGQPDPQRLFQRELSKAFLLGLVVFLLVFWVVMEMVPLVIILKAGKTPPAIFFLFPLIGLALIALAIKGMTVPWREKQRAANVFYALTNRRALILGAETNDAVQSVLPAEFTVARRDLPGGKGDVVLKREQRRMGRNRVTVEIGFFGVQGALEVERLARELAHTAG